MTPQTIRLGGLEARVVEAVPPDGARDAPVIVLLHGFSMRADDLSPFGSSLGLEASFVFPEGPRDLLAEGLGGRAWWSIDTARRDADVARGVERDLSPEDPAGLPAARETLLLLLGEVGRRWPRRPLFLGGFSQGAILSLDVVLRARPDVSGLILLSGARITAEAWAPLFGAVRALPVFQSHGRNDRELSYTAAASLAADLADSGARVTWRPFDGGHEIPLVVFRELKKFIRQRLAEREPSHFS